MSLFGGDDSVPQTPTSQEDDLTDYPAPSRSPTPQYAQDPPLALHPLYSDEEEVEDSEYENESDLESDQEPSRPNRFPGRPHQWRRYTAPDRQVAAALEKIEARDLGAHLYNAHSLKRRVRRPAEQLAGVESWQSRDSWLRKGDELEFTDPTGEVQMELVPKKHWTAWPQPPHTFSAFEIGPANADSDKDTWDGRRFDRRDAGEVLRGEMLALFMRVAKEKWSSRESDTEHADNSPIARVSSGLGSRGTQGAPCSLAAASGQGSSGVELRDAHGSIGDGALPLASAPEESQHPHSTGRQSLIGKPVVLADDTKAQDILQPSVNSLLSQLDYLALGVRRTRLNHLGRGDDSDKSTSEFTSDAASRPSSRRGSQRARARKTGSRLSSRTGPSSKGKKKPGRQKAHAEHDGDSASEYPADYDEGTATEAGSSENSPAKPKRNKSQDSSNEEYSSATSNRQHEQVGLMDWSEVLGIAAMTGWNEKAVARTAQRCAALFGESMAFRPFDESLATKSVSEPVYYTPSTIPVPENLVIGASLGPKRPYFEAGTLRCPHKDCWGHEQDFEYQYRVIEHVKRVHQYDPHTNDSDNEERMTGGVHFDGFLQPITAKRGWIGSGRLSSRNTGSEPLKPRKKQKIANEACD
ncbi:hypothetical protein BU26DRAFT_150228 [Trematosphaeria pertusa]|uniref:Rrn9 domain-containing protein n=1 Tax=Trematosphaeria pertusa TaxID=390896 RepID=A0A6A6IWX7_9PLEO|nr:uncharacterized protein BU26DRAFT_150228 [Trematosphaeria pertusa]KAF2255051.1 hypothetical protein BU26DRAFT_150228 [Trematosphaeria pertusa]